MSDRRDRALGFLADAGPVLAESLDLSTTLGRIAHLAVPRFADWCFVDVIDDRGVLARVDVACADPTKRDLAERFRRWPARLDDASRPAVQAMLQGRAVVFHLEDPASLASLVQSDEHHQAIVDTGARAAVWAPLVARARTLGVLTFAGADVFTVDDVRVAEQVARLAALAIDNARLYRAARDAEDRERLLADASAAVFASLDYEVTIETVAQLAVPALADGCVVDLVEPAGTTRPVAFAGPEEKLVLARELRRRFPPDPRAPGGIGRVIRTGQPELVRDLSDPILAGVARGPEHRRLLDAIGIRSQIVVPMIARGRVLGALTMVTTDDSRPRFDEAALRLAGALADRCALAVDNARLYKDARDAVAQRDEFLSIASHELRTPLTPLRLQLETLRRRIDDVARTPVEREWLAARIAMMLRQVERLDRLTTTLLDLARLVGGRLDLQRAPVDLAAVVREVDESLRGSDSKRIVDLDLPPSVVGVWDRLRLEQVVTNLLSNALKYGAGKPVKVQLTVENGDAVLAVTDQGIGIAHEHQLRIFERFERAVSSRNFGGLGLGLYITRQIVEHMGGTIAVASELGKGSTFTVRLPLG